MLRYIKAFWTAFNMTLRGEKPIRPHEALWDWIEQGHYLAEAVLDEADHHGLDRAAREQLTIHIEGRTMSMQTILAAVIYHTGQEYPYLLDHPTPHSITAIYASNLNDQFYVTRLHESALDSPVQARLLALRDHLSAVPPSHAERSG